MLRGRQSTSGVHRCRHHDPDRHSPGHPAAAAAATRAFRWGPGRNLITLTHSFMKNCGFGKMWNGIRDFLFFFLYIFQRITVTMSHSVVSNWLCRLDQAREINLWGWLDFNIIILKFESKDVCWQNLDAYELNVGGNFQLSYFLRSNPPPKNIVNPPPCCCWHWLAKIFLNCNQSLKPCNR